MTRTATAPVLKSPFPYAGGKATVAGLVWSRLGNVNNFCEPFAGSLAVLMRRPADHFLAGVRKETVNDKNHFVTNFWRAVKCDPDAVAEYCDWPVLEADLHARHQWLMKSDHGKTWRKKMAEDPDHFDAKVAGWWCWGQCCWIGSGWCADDFTDRKQMPQLNPTRGVHRESGSTGELTKGRPQLTDAYDIGRGVNGNGNQWKQIPDLGTQGSRGDAATSLKMPRLTGNRKGNEYYPGIGVHNIDPEADGTCDARRAWLVDWMRRLSDRLRLVRTCYGHWSRICDSDSTLTRLGSTGVFLDPPYPTERADDGKKSRDGQIYATDKGADLNELRDEILVWCEKWGDDPQMRIALCGYEGDGYSKLVDERGWTCESWEANGGYANQRRAGKGKAANAKRERIWFSPGCTAAPASLFDSISSEDDE